MPHDYDEWNESSGKKDTRALSFISGTLKFTSILIVTFIVCTAGLWLYHHGDELHEAERSLPQGGSIVMSPITLVLWFNGVELRPDEVFEAYRQRRQAEFDEPHPYDFEPVDRDYFTTD